MDSGVGGLNSGNNGMAFNSGVDSTVNVQPSGAIGLGSGTSNNQMINKEHDID